MKYIDVEFDQATIVTVAEIRAAVARVLPEQLDEVDAGLSEVLANDVIRDVMNHRERDWLQGDIVRDDNGTVWQRAGGQWRKMGHAGLYSHEKPARPLTLIDSPDDRREQARRARALERARDDGAPI